MKFSCPARLRVEKDVVIRIHRNLKGKGTINVKLNQEVIPSDIIGSAYQSVGFRIINLAEALSIDPASVEKYLKRKIGQTIFKGELLAYRTGWLVGKKIVTSPIDGVLDFLNPKTGELRLNFLPKKDDLPAGVYGIVETIDNQKGQIIIRAQASIVHGVFGSGNLRDGILRIITKRDELVGKTFITSNLNEQILVGGSLVFKETIAAAISNGVSGLVIGGINAKDYKSMAGGRLIFPKKLENDIGISVIVCEGFGSIPIGVDIDELLKKFEGKFISMDGNAANIYLPSFESSSLIKVRSVHLPPVQQSLNLSNFLPEVDLKIGLKVRIIGNSYQGTIGKLIALDQTETLIPSGIKTYMVTVETSSKRIQVPVANIEVIL